MNEKDLTIDWSNFSDPITQTCYCDCGKNYKSHAKAIIHNSSTLTLSKDPCPGCGKSSGNIRRIVSDTEDWALQ